MPDMAIRVQPRARRNEIAGERDGAIVIRVTAPPVEGKANAAVRRLIAQKLGVPAGRVQVAKGQKGRDKLIRVDGLDSEAVRAALLR
jgi:uncharacterized protein (TIGR00251 family)